MSDDLPYEAPDPIHFGRLKRDDLLYPEISHSIVVVDPKVVSDFNESHRAQMMGYLTITGYRLAILLSFKYADLRHHPVVR